MTYDQMPDQPGTPAPTAIPTPIPTPSLSCSFVAGWNMMFMSDYAKALTQLDSHFPGKGFKGFIEQLATYPIILRASAIISIIIIIVIAISMLKHVTRRCFTVFLMLFSFLLPSFYPCFALFRALLLPLLQHAMRMHKFNLREQNRKSCII